MVIPAERVEIYLFAGPTPLDVVRRFNLFNGGGVLPSRWGMGFTHRVPRLYTASDVEQEVRDFNERGFPLDFIGLEPGWQSKSYPCTFDWRELKIEDAGNGKFNTSISPAGKSKPDNIGNVTWRYMTSR